MGQAKGERKQGMIREGKIGVREATCLITIAITNRVFFTSPGLLAKTLGTTGWYMTLISAAFGALGFTPIYLLLKRYPGKNLIEIFQIVFGKIISLPFLILLVLLFTLNAAIMLREFAEVMKVYVLPLTPITYTMSILVLFVAVASILGLESMARFSSFIAVMLLIGFGSVLALSSGEYKLHRLAPILGYGLGGTIVTGMQRSTVYADAIILAVVAGSMQGVSHIKKAGYSSITLSGIFISLSFVAFTLTFPYYSAAEITAPMYHMVALIDYGRFLQRLEAIFLFVWNISTFVSVAINFYAGASTYCKTFRIQDARPVIIPLAILTFALAMVPKDISEVAMGYVQNIRQYGWTGFFLPPAAALLVSMLRKKGGETSNA
jgi:spore germination protein (amino acid permease)